MTVSSWHRHIAIYAVGGVLAFVVLPLSVWAGSDGRRMTLGANRAYDDPAPGFALPLDQLAGTSLPRPSPPADSELRPQIAPSTAPQTTPSADTPVAVQPVAETSPVRVVPASDPSSSEEKPASTPAFEPSPVPAASAAERPQQASARHEKARGEAALKVPAKAAAETDRVRVTAPSSKVTVRNDKVRVEAPYTRVAIDEGRVRVRAPFVDLDIRF